MPCSVTARSSPASSRNESSLSRPACSTGIRRANFVRRGRTQSRASPDVQSQPGHRLQAVDTCPFLHARLIATWTFYHRMGGLYSFLKLWEVQGHSGVDFIGVFDLVHFLDNLNVFVVIIKALGNGGEGIAGLDLILADHVLNRDVAF